MSKPTKTTIKAITIFTGLPGSGKSKRLIELVNRARAAHRPVLTFACGDSPWMWQRDSVRTQRVLGCRQLGLICRLDHFVSAAECPAVLEGLPPGTLVAFEEAHYFPPELVPHWAKAAQRGLKVLICTPSEIQLRLLREHPHTETKFVVRCERCGQADATTFAVTPGEDSTCAMCADCHRTKVAEARAELVERLQRQTPHPGEKVIYQPVELQECAGWKVLRPDSPRRAEIMTRLIHEAGMLDDMPPGTATYLDVGCNTGYFCHRMRQLGFFAEGVDVDKDDVATARILDSYIRRDGVNYVVADAYQYLRDTQDRRFDVTSAFAVFQWLMIQTNVERGVACLEWLFAKTKRLCFLELGYSAEAQYQNKLPIQIDRAWVEELMRARADFDSVQVFEAHQHGLMRDLFVGRKKVSRMAFAKGRAGAAGASQSERLTFRCNICGQTGTAALADLAREKSSCATCGSTVRWRSIIHVLSMELFGKSLALPDFPERSDLAGIGLSDWEGYARPLATKLHYRNTYFHREPKLDIKSINQDMEGTLDFIIASDVFEHVAPPILEAFENLRRLLKPGGVVVFSVPFDKRSQTIEFFPDLHDYQLVPADGLFYVRNTTKEGTVQIFEKPAFHDGVGTTLVMRQFSEADLVAKCHQAGFASVKIHHENCPSHGIIWNCDTSLPLSLRRIDPQPDPEWDGLCAKVLERAASRAHQDDVVRLLAQLLPRFVSPSLYQRYFRFWEANGFHLTPVHFHQPLPDTRSLSDELWRRSSALSGLDMNDAVQLDLLRKVFPRYRAEYEQLPIQPTDSTHEFYLDNTRFSGTDALALYCMVRHFQPHLIIEVGSGPSTRLSAQAGRRNGQTQLICIDPFPDPVVKAGFPGLTSLISRHVQEVGLDTFQQLSSGDILFIDSSHIVTCGSDVNYLLLEVLPRLQPGVIVHLHDIFLPNEYPRDWVKQEFRFWNEQYLLQAFLLFNTGFEVLLANSYLGHRYRSQMQATFPTSPWWGGGSFWMRRKPKRKQLNPSAS